MQQVLSDWAREARRGRPADFKGWTFFETNCLSELAKLARNGQIDGVRSFLAGRDVLLPGSVLSEISAAPDIANELAPLLSAANFFLAPDISRFWDCDLWNFINVDGHPRNVLGVTPVPPDLLRRLSTYEPFIRAVEQSRAAISSEYRQRVQPDVGAGLDERQLLIIVWERINKRATDWLKLEIPTADARPEAFPSFFTFYYVYYFRYVKPSGVQIHLNDFHDIINTAAAPYCRDFFTERTMAGILRNDVKGRVPPRPVEAASRLFRSGHLQAEQLAQAKAEEAQTATNQPLLLATNVWTINDLREQVRGAA